jgi:hypothetical protein
VKLLPSSAELKNAWSYAYNDFDLVGDFGEQFKNITGILYISIPPTKNFNPFKAEIQLKFLYCYIENWLFTVSNTEA